MCCRDLQGARRLAGFAEDHLLAAIPMHRMISIMSALDHGVGRERSEKIVSLQREIHEMGVVAPEIRH